ncbi:hypothetical protein CGI85_25340, partial [Vibrio parahaemolyticus]
MNYIFILILVYLSFIHIKSSERLKPKTYDEVRSGKHRNSMNRYVPLYIGLVLVFILYNYNNYHDEQLTHV